jgi:hypothetical protein
MHSSTKAEQLNVILKEGSGLARRDCSGLADRACLNHYRRPRFASHHAS